MSVMELCRTVSCRNITPERIIEQYAPHTRAYFNEARSSEAAIPVIIPVHNEPDLPYALRTLARSTEPVIPVVVENGSNDDTAVVARVMGAVVLQTPQASKIKATQLGLAWAQEEMRAHEVLFTDGDTLMPKTWAGAMRGILETISMEQGTILFGGMAIWHGPSKTADVLRTMVGYAKGKLLQRHGERPIVRGGNYALCLDRAGAMLDSLNALDPDIFPGADVAISKAVTDVGAVATSYLGLEATVVSRGDRVKSFYEFIDNHRNNRRAMQASYAAQYGGQVHESDELN